jgi:hypothetical protein
MRDPLPPPSLLVQASKPLAEKLSLMTLPYHVHEILLGFLGYHFILYVVSPALSNLVFPKAYNGFHQRTRLNWDIHWVSMIQSLFICAAALWVTVKDEQRHEMDWRGRLWGYTPASGMVQGFAAGYFLWDLQVSAQYIHISGPSALIHAIGALAVTCIGFVCLYIKHLIVPLTNSPRNPSETITASPSSSTNSQPPSSISTGSAANSASQAQDFSFTTVSRCSSHSSAAASYGEHTSPT